jgi:hypothetical protein
LTDRGPKCGSDAHISEAGGWKAESSPGQTPTREQICARCAPGGGPHTCASAGVAMAAEFSVMSGVDDASRIR